MALGRISLDSLAVVSALDLHPSGPGSNLTRLFGTVVSALDFHASGLSRIQPKPDFFFLSIVYQTTQPAIVYVAIADHVIKIQVMVIHSSAIPPVTSERCVKRVGKLKKNDWARVLGHWQIV